MLQLNQIELRRGAKLLFENASLQAHAGQRMGIIGVNGSGKSSLFALILGQLEADAGQLQINPRDVIAHVAQESPHSGQPALEFVQDGDRTCGNSRPASPNSRPSTVMTNDCTTFTSKWTISMVLPPKHGRRDYYTGWVLKPTSYANP
ncbi:MAG TPA: ATP-binding cassette domain-containing protein [Xanthomonadales bacterium]